LEQKEYVVTIGYNGTSEKRLFSAKERKNGDLLIVPTKAENVTETDNDVQKNALTSSVRYPSKHQKYSVHRSVNSKDKINAVKHELILEDGRIKETLNYSKAIKHFGNLIPLFSRRTPNLLPDHYDLREKDRLSTLRKIGNMDGKRSMLVSTIFVGSADMRASDVRTGKLCQKRLIRFEYFTVVFLYSFLTLPAHSSGELQHFATIDTSTMSPNQKELLKHIADGVAPSDAYGLHINLVQLLGNRCWHLIQYQERLTDKIEIDDVKIVSNGVYNKSKWQKSPCIKSPKISNNFPLRTAMSFNFKW
jgi:hypothetical protein